MNQPLLLHVVERLEAFVGKLPGAIQKPILHELTPLKELFLQQRPPRILLAGAGDSSLEEILQMLFDYPSAPGELSAFALNRWNDIDVLDHGSISVIDARDSDFKDVEVELDRQRPDAVLFLEGKTKKSSGKDLEDLTRSITSLSEGSADPLPVFIVTVSNPTKRAGSDLADTQKAIERIPRRGKGSLRLAGSYPLEKLQTEAGRREFVTALARELPNAARIEMARISKDKAVQADIAQILIKSTTAICTAIGAQPIPLADLPVLTTLQLVMVSGIMYVSGREKSLRAATEFIGALGVNLGAGMLLREGARAILKFFPGWGNIVCGAVAGAGTYSIGRAAAAFFIEGVSIKDARRTYLASRRRASKTRLSAKRATLRLSQTDGDASDHNL